MSTGVDDEYLLHDETLLSIRGRPTSLCPRSVSASKHGTEGSDDPTGGLMACLASSSSQGSSARIVWVVSPKQDAQSSSMGGAGSLLVGGRARRSIQPGRAGSKPFASSRPSFLKMLRIWVSTTCRSRRVAVAISPRTQAPALKVAPACQVRGGAASGADDRWVEHALTGDPLQRVGKHRQIDTRSLSR